MQRVLYALGVDYPIHLLYARDEYRVFGVLRYIKLRDAALGRVLYRVHCEVGEAYQHFVRGRVIRVPGYAAARAQLVVRAVAEYAVALAQLLHNLCHYPPYLFLGIKAAEEYVEFIARHSRHHAAVVVEVFQHISRSRYIIIAEVVPVGIVDVFQIVYIEHEERRGL